MYILKKDLTDMKFLLRLLGELGRNNMKKKEVKQGEVWMCNLPKGEDSEQMGVRPCLIISADARNETSSNVFVFPITHARKKEQPCHYILHKENYPFFKHKILLPIRGFSSTDMYYK